jgi:hypothetical protein
VVAKIEPLIAMARTRHHVSWKQRAQERGPSDSSGGLKGLRATHESLLRERGRGGSSHSK